VLALGIVNLFLAAAALLIGTVPTIH